MQLSSRGLYAVTAMVKLAARRNEPASSPGRGEIAARRQRSRCCLEQMFGGWRRAGLTTSARGPGGGYRLGPPANAVTFAEVLLGLEEPPGATRCDESTAAACLRWSEGFDAEASARRRPHDLCAELGLQSELFLASMPLGHRVAGKARGRALPRREPVAAA